MYCGREWNHDGRQRVTAVMVWHTVPGQSSYSSSTKQGRDVSYSVSFLALRELSTNSQGVKPVSRAFENIDTASSRAPPNRLPIVNKLDGSEEMRSLPARDATMVFIAPDATKPLQRLAVVDPEECLILDLRLHVVDRIA